LRNAGRAITGKWEGEQSTIQTGTGRLFKSSSRNRRGEDEAGEITSINGDVPQIIVQVPEDVEIRDKLG